MTLPRWLLAALLLCWAVVLQAAPVAIPPLSARVTDLTQTLDAGQRAQLESQLAGLEQRKGAQLLRELRGKELGLLVVARNPQKPSVARLWKIQPEDL